MILEDALDSPTSIGLARSNIRDSTSIYTMDRVRLGRFLVRWALATRIWGLSQASASLVTSLPDVLASISEAFMDSMTKEFGQSPLLSRQFVEAVTNMVFPRIMVEPSTEGVSPLEAIDFYVTKARAIPQVGAIFARYFDDNLELFTLLTNDEYDDDIMQELINIEKQADRLASNLCIQYNYIPALYVTEDVAIPRDASKFYEAAGHGK